MARHGPLGCAFGVKICSVGRRGRPIQGRGCTIWCNCQWVRDRGPTRPSRSREAPTSAPKHRRPRVAAEMGVDAWRSPGVPVPRGHSQLILGRISRLPHARPPIPAFPLSWKSSSNSGGRRRRRRRRRGGRGRGGPRAARPASAARRARGPPAGSHRAARARGARTREGTRPPTIELGF